MTDESLARLERALRNDPNDRATRTRLLAELIRAGRTDDAWRRLLAAFRASDAGPDREALGDLVDAFGAPFTLEPFPAHLGWPLRQLGAGAAPVTVGRMADLSLPRAFTLSRKHFSVAYLGRGQFHVQDLASSCGTYLQAPASAAAERVREAVVEEGVRIGNVHSGVELRLGWDDEPLPPPRLNL